MAEGRDPGSSATVNVLLYRWLAVADLELSTLHSHEGYIRRAIRPSLGGWQLRRLQHRVDAIDQLYAHLRRCSKLCDGRPYVEKHTTEQPHSCAAERCRRHACRPMQPRTIRQIHAILRTALGYAVKWGWIDRNPAQHASPPRITASEIHPPDPKQAARLVETASNLDRELGVFVWLAMVTGARRGELCALRWSDLRADERDLLIARSYVTRRGGRLVKDTKTHQRRRLASTPPRLTSSPNIGTAARSEPKTPASTSWRTVTSSRATASARSPGCRTPSLTSSSAPPRRRAFHAIHDLRHYTATQMIAAGVDLRTVAGRLGHSGGGSTTLKVYAHWTRPADQHAAELLARQLRRPGDGDAR